MGAYIGSINEIKEFTNSNDYKIKAIQPLKYNNETMQFVVFYRKKRAKVLFKKLFNIQLNKGG